MLPLFMALALAPPTTVDPLDVPAPAPAVSEPAPAPKDADPVVCRSQVIVGSRLPVKVCTRASQDASRKRSAQDAVTKFQNSNAMRGPGDYVKPPH